MDDDWEFPSGGMDPDVPSENPAQVVGEDEEIGNNGLRKKIVKEGEGWETPNSGDEVEVHYTGTFLNGIEFDSSIARGAPFNFKLGQGHVIKGWDEGIKTMKKGEKSLFIIPPELAYGESGSPPTIPSNSTLQFEVELLSWISVKDISKDGGILKKVLAKGESWQNPRDPDEVFVNYEAHLDDGAMVSKENGVEFTVKDGHFCPALSKAVKTMKKGEKALLTVKPEYGFGGSGRSAIMDGFYVPANATLLINLDLISWKRVSDINNDGNVVKKVLKEGEGYEHPNDGSTVQLKLIGKLHDGTVFVRHGHNEDSLLEFKVDEDQVIEGLDRAIKTMNKAEVALLTIQPNYAFGQSESSHALAVVPGNSVVYYEVEIVSFVKEKESWELSKDEKLAAAKKKKEEGNIWFRVGKYKRASKRYEKAVGFVEHESSFSEEEKKEAELLKVACNLNNAACKLKLKEYKEAKKWCDDVLEIDADNIKALYRRAQAYIYLVEYELAELDIKKALEISPDNRDVKLVYKTLKDKVREYDKKDAKFYGNIFTKLKTLEPDEFKGTDGKGRAVPNTVDRLKSLLPKILAEQRGHGFSKTWVISLVIILLAMLCAFYLKN